MSISECIFFSAERKIQRLLAVDYTCCILFPQAGISSCNSVWMRTYSTLSTQTVIIIYTWEVEPQCRVCSEGQIRWGSATPAILPHCYFCSEHPQISHSLHHPPHFQHSPHSISPLTQEVINNLKHQFRDWPHTNANIVVSTRFMLFCTVVYGLVGITTTFYNQIHLWKSCCYRHICSGTNINY